MKRKLVFAMALLLCLSSVPVSTAFADGDTVEANYLPGYEAVKYGKGEGLLSVEANSIAQTPEGYLWIGTYSGLYRYDGTVFEKVSPDSRVSSVMAVFSDSKGNLWFGTNDSGVGYYSPEEKKTYFFSKKDGLDSDSIRAITEDHLGNIYIGTVEGLSIIDPDGNVCKPAAYSDLGGIRSLDASDKWIVGVTSSGLVFMANEQSVPVSLHPQTHGVDYTSVAIGDDGHILVGTSASELEEYIYKYDKLVSVNSFDGGELSYFSAITYDGVDNKWYVCAENGMAVIDRTTGGVRPLTQQGFESSVCGAIRDYQGNIWFASNKKGIMKFSPNPFSDVFIKAGIQKTVVNAMAVKGNDLYIGKDDGLCILDTETYEVRGYRYIKGFDGIRIRHIFKDSADNMWICTYGKEGVYKINNNGTIIHFNEETGTVGGRFRYADELLDGTIVVASNLGLSFIKDDKVVSTIGRHNGLETSQILTIVQAADGTIYAGSDGGGIYVIRDGRIISCIDEEDGLESLVVLRIVPYGGGYFYITSNAIYYDNGETIKRLENFPYSNNYDIRITSDNKAWISSSAGIFILNAEDLVNDGEYMYTLLDDTMGFNTTLTANAWNIVLDGDRFLLCCTDGIREISMSNYDYFDKSCHIELKYIYADETEIQPEADGSFILPPTKGRIRIGAAILNYTLSNPEIRIFLEGASDTGIQARQSTAPELVYTNLPYGKYKLHVQIIDSETYKVAREEIFHIVKTPRPFERLTVRLLIAAAAMGLVALIVFQILRSTIIRRQYEQIRIAKDEAERANSAKSRFLANMSHEIRTPINTIMGMDEMILREDTENVPKPYVRHVTGYATDIKRASETLLGLVNDVLDLSKIESGKMNLVEQEYDTRELLRSIATMIRVRSNEKDLTFETKIDPMLPEGLYGDMGKIKQVVLNLLTNAVKYTEKGGFVLKVEVKGIYEDCCEIYFAVEDTGIGVREEDMAKLFAPFERLDEKRNSGIQGTGLGLDISRQFVALMGGELRCESEYGKGSVFYFSIRQKIVNENGIGQFSEKDSHGNNGVYVPEFVASEGRVLVVDDNEMNLLVIKGLLKGTKVRVFTAMSGKECIDILRNESFHAVLLDHMMPEMDGPETLKRIREELPERDDVPIIALTANGANDGGSFYKEAGFTDYLAKPVDGEKLEKTLKKYMPDSILENVADNTEPVEHEDKLPEDMLWLKETKGISVEDGIKYCGGAESFVKSIKTFYDMVTENSDVIEKAFEDNDIELYTVKVHALKSSARIIGATALSILAEKLENAGKSGDTVLITEETGELLARYRAYKDILSGFSTGSGEEAPEAEAETFAEAYDALREFIPQMDYDSAEMVLNEMASYHMSEEDKAFFERLTVLLKKLDWDGMAKLLAEKQA